MSRKACANLRTGARLSLESETPRGLNPEASLLSRVPDGLRAVLNLQFSTLPNPPRKTQRTPSEIKGQSARAEEQGRHGRGPYISAWRFYPGALGGSLVKRFPRKTCAYVQRGF